jgi:hypothetical protein
MEKTEANNEDCGNILLPSSNPDGDDSIKEPDESEY